MSRVRVGRWLEVNEMTVRVVMLLAFIFHQRLLQLKWSKQLHDPNLMVSWGAEKMVFNVCALLHITGGFISLFVNFKQNKLHIVKHFLLGHLRCYARLVFDAFLFPQISLNIFLNSKDSPPCSFYLGVTILVYFPMHMTFTGLKPLILSSINRPSL